MDAYVNLKREASKAKLKGLRLLAEGGFDKTFEASVSLHEAARIERAGIVKLPGRSRDVCLSSAIEECGCYIDAQAPRWAEMAWRRVGIILEQQDSANSDEMSAEVSVLGMAPYLLRPETPEDWWRDQRLNRIREKYVVQQGEFRKTLIRSRFLVECMRMGTLLPSEHSLRSGLRKELEVLVANFVGDPYLWFALYRLEDSFGRIAPAMEAIWRASILEPQNEDFRVLHFNTLSTVPEMRGALERQIKEISANRMMESADILISHALIMLQRARPKPKGESSALRTAHEDLEIAAVKIAAAPDSLRAEYLRKARLLLKIATEGREASSEELESLGIAPASVPNPASTDIAFLMQKNFLMKKKMTEDTSTHLLHQT